MTKASSREYEVVLAANSVSDPHPFPADPDPVQNVNADPDAECQSNVVPVSQPDPGVALCKSFRDIKSEDLDIFSSSYGGGDCILFIFEQTRK